MPPIIDQNVSLPEPRPAVDQSPKYQLCDEDTKADDRRITQTHAASPQEGLVPSGRIAQWMGIDLCATRKLLMMAPEDILSYKKVELLKAAFEWPEASLL